MIASVLHLLDSRFGSNRSRYGVPYRVHAMQRYSLVAMFGGTEVLQLASALYDVAGLNQLNGFKLEDENADKQVKEILKQADAFGHQINWNTWSMNTILNATNCNQQTAILNTVLLQDRLSSEVRKFYTEERSPRDEIERLRIFSDDLVRSLKVNPRVVGDAKRGRAPEIPTLRAKDAIRDLMSWNDRLVKLMRADVVAV